jgi:hypothetical protein
MRQRLYLGFAAGFAATLVVSVLMVLKDLAGIMPQLNLIAVLSGLLDAPAWAGWVAHFFIGTIVWGGLFALLAPKIPGSTCLTKAVIFAIGAWLLMQVIILPLDGADFFGVRYSFWAPVVTFILHVIYGFTLGTVFARLHGEWHTKHPADNARGALRYTHY